MIKAKYRKDCPSILSTSHRPERPNSSLLWHSTAIRWRQLLRLPCPTCPSYVSPTNDRSCICPSWNYKLQPCCIVQQETTSPEWIPEPIQADQGPMVPPWSPRRAPSLQRSFSSSTSLKRVRKERQKEDCYSTTDRRNQIMFGRTASVEIPSHPWCRHVNAGTAGGEVWRATGKASRISGRKHHIKEIPKDADDFNDGLSQKQKYIARVQQSAITPTY